MKLVYYRGPEDVLYSFFWVNDQRQQVSPSFTTEDEAKKWLIKSVTTTVDEKPANKTNEIPTFKSKSEETTNDRYQEGFNAGKLFAELEYVEKTQEILELIADAKPSKLLNQIKDLLK